MEITQVTTRLVVTVLLPTGAALTTDTQTGVGQELPAGVTVAAQAILPTPQAPEPLDVVRPGVGVFSLCHERIT